MDVPHPSPILLAESQWVFLAISASEIDLSPREVQGPGRVASPSRGICPRGWGAVSAASACSRKARLDDGLAGSDPRWYLSNRRE